MSEWSEENIDDMLTKVLPARTEVLYSRIISAVARDRGLSGPTVVSRFLWGLATGVREYTGPYSRSFAEDGPFSYTERLIFRWACETTTKLRHKPDAEYLARLLQRPLDEVKSELLRLGPSRGRPPLSAMFEDKGKENG